EDHAERVTLPDRVERGPQLLHVRERKRVAPFGSVHPDGDEIALALDEDVLVRHQPRRSMMVTLAWPPPSHMVWRPHRPPVRSSSFSSVVISRAPVAPSGCPSAIAPPFTLTFARSAPVSRCHASTTDANASLISTRSMSASVMPAFSSACAVAGIGAVSIHTGSAPRTDRWWLRARGFRPCVLTAASLAISSAADASEICDD